MEEELELSCPFCGAGNTLLVDAHTRLQEFTTDCENCCRPFLIRLECEAGEILSVDVSGE